jgi:hypothetical protein
MAEARCPPPLDNDSPKIDTPRRTLTNNVTAFDEARAGAKTSVLRADCWSANPESADTTNT